jgi:hypothetical protein
MHGTNRTFPTILISGKQSYPFYGRLENNIVPNRESLANARKVNIKMEAGANACLPHLSHPSLSDLTLARQGKMHWETSRYFLTTIRVRPVLHRLSLINYTVQV